MAEPLLAAGPASGHELEFPTLADGFGTDADHPLVRRLEAAFRAQGLPWKPAAFTSHSDANLLNEAGCACIMLGPGDLAKAHTREESVEFAQVVAAASLYSRLLADMA